MAAGSPLLTGRILPTLLRLSVPNVLALVSSVLVGIAETYYVGKLGTIPLAAMAIVFPFAMLTQMMSNGAMGGGVSSAISRALGAGDAERAAALLQAHTRDSRSRMHQVLDPAPPVSAPPSKPVWTIAMWMACWSSLPRKPAPTTKPPPI